MSKTKDRGIRHVKSIFRLSKPSSPDPENSKSYSFSKETKSNTKKKDKASKSQAQKSSTENNDYVNPLPSPTETKPVEFNPKDEIAEPNNNEISPRPMAEFSYAMPDPRSEYMNNGALVVEDQHSPQQESFTGINHPEEEIPTSAWNDQVGDTSPLEPHAPPPDWNHADEDAFKSPEERRYSGENRVEPVGFDTSEFENITEDGNFTVNPSSEAQEPRMPLSSHSSEKELEAELEHLAPRRDSENERMEPIEFDTSDFDAIVDDGDKNIHESSYGNHIHPIATTTGDHPHFERENLGSSEYQEGEDSLEETIRNTIRKLDTDDYLGTHIQEHGEGFTDPPSDGPSDHLAYDSERVANEEIIGARPPRAMDEESDFAQYLNDDASILQPSGPAKNRPLSPTNQQRLGATTTSPNNNRRGKAGNKNSLLDKILRILNFEPPNEPVNGLNGRDTPGTRRRNGVKDQKNGKQTATIYKFSFTDSKMGSRAPNDPAPVVQTSTNGSPEDNVQYPTLFSSVMNLRSGTTVESPTEERRKKTKSAGMTRSASAAAFFQGRRPTKHTESVYTKEKDKRKGQSPKADKSKRQTYAEGTIDTPAVVNGNPNGIDVRL